MSWSYQIEVGVPLPKPRIKYPFADMQINDSFFVASDPYDQKLQRLISAHSNNYLGKGKVTVRRVNGGLRVWRVA